MKKVLTALAIASLANAPAFAGVTCQGQVNQIDIEPNGDTYVGWGSWYTRICNPGQSIIVNRGPEADGNTTITPQGCAALISLFSTAKATNKQVSVYVGGSTCTFVNNYNNPYPYFFKFLP